MALCALPEGVVASLEAAGLLAPESIVGRDPAGRPMVDATGEMATWCRVHAAERPDRSEAQALALVAELIDRAIGKPSPP